MNVTIVAIFVAQATLTGAVMYNAVSNGRRLDVIGTLSLVAAFAWAAYYLYANRYSTAEDTQPFPAYISAVGVVGSYLAFHTAEKLDDRRKQQSGSTPTPSG